MIHHLIAGLGNPGGKYETTRHNVGFLAVDRLAGRLGVPLKKLKFQSLIASHQELLLQKPQTFMNLSGRAVREAAHFYKIPPENIIILHDDTALPCGKLRIRASGSDGGHNGLKDILYQLQSDQFIRIKIGVGAKPRPEIDLADWVLSGFSKEDAAVMNDALGRAVDAAVCVLEKGVTTAMNLYN